MEAIAKTKYLKGSPRKARLVIDLIRGQNVSRALSILKFTEKRAAGPIAKTLQSAIANATYLAEQQNIAIDPDDLWVKTCFVDMGPTKNRRRMRPAPQGRAYREQRHYCHITIQLTNDKKAEDEQAAKYAEAKAKRDAVKAREAKKATPKADAPKAAKKAKADKVEDVETPIVETASETVTETPAAAQVDETTAKNNAEAADAKDATSQTPAEKNESEEADERQLDENEQLERQ